jgi:benzil reductase ((S)-benzoin forming)
MNNLYIITGTTRGLGKAILNFINKENNYDDIIMSINRKKIEDYKNNYNLQIDLSKIDLSKIDLFEKLLEKILLTNNPKKIVFINNAFTLGHLDKIDNLNSIDIQNAINTNLISSFILIKSFIKKTKKLNNLHILNISSGASKKPIDGWSIYCSTKSAMEMFIDNIKLEYTNYNCFNIDPGVMNTEMQTNIRAFKGGKDNDYFINLFKNNELQNTLIVAKKIFKEYLK